MKDNIELSELLIEEGFYPFGEIGELTIDTILNESVFEYVFSLKNSLERNKLIAKLEQQAKKLGVSRIFSKALKEYENDLRIDLSTTDDNYIELDKVNGLKLKCGHWTCTKKGVFTTMTTSTGEERTIIVSPIPIIPIERLVDVDDGSEKIKIIFFRDNKWKEVIVPPSVIASKTAILNLADKGILLTSETSKILATYLFDIISMNLSTLPVSKSIRRLGWVGEEFSPYTENIVFDGDAAFAGDFNSVKAVGDYDVWKEELLKLRKESTALHLMVAASFASAILYKLKISSFIVHCWGGTGCGKTVGLMVAMSVWGNPSGGKLVKSMNATQVSIANNATFLHDIPYAMDELQTIKTKDFNYDTLIMNVSQGVDRGRGRSVGGNETLREWNCCFLTTGEEPITKITSGGGTKNRVIEIEARTPVVEDGHRAVEIVTENYGFAGKEFVKNLPSEEELCRRYNEISRKVMEKKETTGKQLMAISSIMLADEISTDLIFKDNRLDIEEVIKYIDSIEDISSATRAYELVGYWIAENINKFSANIVEDSNYHGEIYGLIDGIDCFVNKNVLSNYLNSAGFDFDAVKQDWCKNGILIKDGDQFTSRKRIGLVYGRKWIHLILEDALDTEEGEDIPF